MKKKVFALLLVLALTVGLLPVSVLAAQGGTFLFSVSTAAQTVVLPEKVSYDAGQTIKEALLASGHIFDGIDGGMIYRIDGVDGNYVRSDERGGYDLDAAAGSIAFFCFSERESFVTANRQELMQVMACYAEEEADVKAAAKAEYDYAARYYASAADILLHTMAADLQSAMDTYRQSLTGTAYAVTFSDGEENYAESNYPGVSLKAVNLYGREYADDNGDGVLQLPAGQYSFTLTQSSNCVTGCVTVTASDTVTARLPAGQWLAQDGVFSLGSGTDFDENALPMTCEANTLTVTVPDTVGTAANVSACLHYDGSQFTDAPTLWVSYTRSDGTVISPETDSRMSQRPFDSKVSVFFKGIFTAGDIPARAELRLCADDAGGYTRSQVYTVLFVRQATLKGLKLTAQNGVGQAPTESFAANKTEYTYRVLNTVTAITVEPQMNAEGYLCTVNGAALENGAATVAIDGSTDITVAVSSPKSGNAATTYTLHIEPHSGSAISFHTDSADVTLRVYNANEEELLSYKEKLMSGGYSYKYTLVPGEVYHYVASKAGCYFSSRDFTTESFSGSVIHVTVMDEDWLTGLTLASRSTMAENTLYPLDTDFSAEDHSYTVTVSDRASAMYAAVTSSLENGKLTAEYDKITAYESTNGTHQSITLTSGKAKSMSYLLMSNALENTLTLRVSKPQEGINYYQDYTVRVKRQLSLESLTAVCAGTALALDPSYTDTATEYNVLVSMAADRLELTTALHGADMPPSYDSDGYRVTVNGALPENGVSLIPLTGDETTETVTVVVTNDHTGDSTPITITVHKTPSVALSLQADPADALAVITDTRTKQRVWPQNGAWSLSRGFSYTYTVTARGYCGISGRIDVEEAQGQTRLLIDDTPLTVTSQEGALSALWTVKLTKAAENTAINHNMNAQWADFRGTSYTYNEKTDTVEEGGTLYSNNGVVDAALPVSAEDSTLYWAAKLGEGYSESAVGCPILADDAIITYSGSTIYKVDSVSGQVLATGQMLGGSSFAINNSTYYDGMIFVGQAGGMIQAFNAETLESLWVYTDPLGGQPNCPIAAYDGYIYTGFWNGETLNAGFACIPVTDEDPTTGSEQKLAAWNYVCKGGFYWAGAYVCDDYLLVGTDDGQSGYTNKGQLNMSSALLMLDRKTGEVLDRRDGLASDIRSNVSYDAQSNAYYFTSKGGYFYRARTELAQGKWTISQLDALRLANGTDSDETPAMSTCTPVVYNGRAYIGVSGSGQFTAYSGHNITVIDLTSWSIAYTVTTQGYPQTSGLLTTAYENSTGYVYVYFFDNYTPGKLRVLRDKAGQTKAELVTKESYFDKGVTTVYDTPYALFTPAGDQAQYAICSPICDQYGTVYFKNDSACLMAFGSCVVSLDIVQQPDKTEYAPGEQFDPTGMKVTATYENGAVRDVTDYVSYTRDALTAEDTAVTVSFPYAMYHNGDNADGTSTAGVLSSTPHADVAVSVTGSARLLGDADGNGKVNALDASLVLQYAAQLNVTIDTEMADVNNDGKVNALDASLILQYAAQLITGFGKKN